MEYAFYVKNSVLKCDNKISQVKQRNSIMWVSK